MVVKPNLGPHAGAAQNNLSFTRAFNRIMLAPGRQYITLGGVPFTARARLTQRGAHEGEPVIVFYSGGREKARSYACCWGLQTNCNSTHINTYTAAL